MKTPFNYGPLYQPTLVCELMAVAGLAGNRALLKNKNDHTQALGQLLYNDQAENLTLVVEATLALYYQVRNSTTRVGLVAAFASYYHAIAGKSLVGSIARIIDTLVDEIAQDLPFFQNSFGWIDIMDGLYTNTKKFMTSTLGDKIVKVFNHVVAYSLYAKMGMDFDEGLFATLEKKVIRPTIWNVLSFLDAVVGLILFVCKAGRQALMTGNINCFFIDDGVLSAWLDEASTLRKNSEFSGNPSVLGMAVPIYLAKVRACITTGKTMLPYFKKGREHSMLFNAILELESVEKRHQCAMLASSFRRAPVAVLLYGSAGVAKSFIATGLFNHYCSVRGIASEDAKMWTRTENDDFYSGYKSWFAGVLYDDAAKYRKNVIQGVDPSIGDIITACNNIAFVTPQADLPDKGKVPFLSEWVGVTSNLGDLNANLYFNSSAAFLRRFAVRITPIVKPQFRMPGEDKIDTSFLPDGVQYPELWDFEVHTARVNGLNGEFVHEVTFTSYADLLVYMTGVYQRHIDQQTRLMETVSKIGPEKLCKCHLPLSICACGPQPHGPFLADENPIEPQVDADTCTLKHWDRIMALSTQKHALYTEHTDKVVRAFIKQMYDDEHVAQWFDPTHCDERSDEEVISSMTDYFSSSVKEFIALDSRERLNLLSDGKFNMTNDGAYDLEYLSFTPKIGAPSFYLEEQLSSLRSQIIDYVGTFNDKELALLDVYLYEHAPQHIASGFGLGDIIRGGYDYVKYYSDRIEDPDRTRVREFLMDTRKPCWYERLGVTFAVAYFENWYVHKMVNLFVAIPGVTKIITWGVKRANRDQPRYALTSAAREYDNSLGGDNKILKLLLGALAAVGTLSALYKLAQWFMKPKAGCEREGCMATDDRCPPIGASQRNWDCDTIKGEQFTELRSFVPQLDLNAIGRKPVVREAEKKNVWVTPERNITRLDVDPRRPHDEDQAHAALRKNACFATVRGKFHAGTGTGNTRVLIVDTETIVMNNHSLPVDAVITVWLGKKTDIGVQPSYVLNVDEEMVTRYPDRDLAVVKTWAMPNAFKDIKHLFPKRGFQSVGPASYFLKEKSGKLTRRTVVGANLRRLYGLDGADGVSCYAWASAPMEPTEVGHCGMPLVVNSPLGSVVVGIHAGYHALTNTAWAVRIDREDLDHDVHPQMGDIEPAFPIAQVKVERLDCNAKLYTDYHQDGHMITYGALKTFVARPKFTGTHTPFAHHVFARGEEFEPPIEDCMAAPRSAGWEQPQSVLSTYLHPTHSMKEMIMRACTEAYVEHVSSNLTEEDWKDIHPVPLSVAVNGFPGVPNVDAQKFTTSAGHGKRGPKLQFLTEPEKFEEWESYRFYTEAVHLEIDQMRERAYLGIRPNAIYDSVFKDELLSKVKVAMGKARSIYLCPVALLTNIRMSTLGLCRVMIRRRDVFGVAIGLNTHSEEWDDVYNLCQQLEGDNWIAGDFKNFESVLNLLISNCVSKVFVRLAERSGNYSPEELMALRVWLADISNATINFFGELITLLGGEASGQQMTTPFNCVANNLLHMYAYVIIYAKPGDRYLEFLAIARTFFEFVRRNTLGDDVYLKVSPEKPEYNHTSIMNAFAAIGITYTMADKGAESRPYISWKEVTFLKRSFVDHSAFPGMKVAALDRKSVYKMLCYTVPSKSVSREEQLAAAMACAQAEAFFHDKQFFEQIQELIESLPKTPELLARMKAFPAPTWNTMCKRFIDSSPKLKARLMVPGILPETTETKDSYCHASDLELQMEWSVDPWGSTTMECSSEVRIYGRDRLSSKKVPKAGTFEITSELENTDFSKNFRKTPKNLPTPNVREMAPLVVEKAINKVKKQKRSADRRRYWKDLQLQADIDYRCLDCIHAKRAHCGCKEELERLNQLLDIANDCLDKTLEHVAQMDHIMRRDRARQQRTGCVVQADIDYDTVSVPTGSAALNTNTDVAQENTVFKNEPVGERVAFGSHVSTLVSSMKLPQQLATYLHRPRLIYSYSWAENGSNGLKASFRPWDLYFGSADMTNKLNGYAMLRSKLHLKFLINGSPFYYGSMMAAYSPLVGYRADTATASTTGLTLVAVSQRPHVWIENQNCSTVHMELPFLYPYPYLSLAARSTLQNMGAIDLYQFAPLLSANGTSSTNVDIQVYAWAEGTEMTGPTNLPIVQSEFVPDGQISRTASTVQAAAGALSKIPVIGAYAKATEMASKSLAGAASYFGFTNVPNTSDVQPFKPMPFQLASTEISEPVNKLSLQTKQETTIGAAQHGGPKEDELTVKSLAGRSSFLVGTQWNTTAAPGEILFTAAVTPQMFNSANSQVAHTPMGWIANLFQYWRGPIKFTFKVIRSPYHRGRVQISWDSQASTFATGPSVGNPNTLTTVMDLDEDSECSFVVPYMKPELFLETFNTSTTGTAPWSTDAAPVGSWPGTNGILNVRVLNRLTAPEPSSSATILVFVNAADEFEFAGPREYQTRNGDSQLQLNAATSSVLQADIAYDDEDEAHELAPDGCDMAVYQQVFGERVTSIRELLHRSSLSFMWQGMSYNTTAGAGTCQFKVPFKRMPPPPGVMNNAWNVGTTSSGPGQRVFYTKFHPILQMTSCFIGYKGSVNVTLNVDQPSTGAVIDTLAIGRKPFGNTLTSTQRLPSLDVFGEPAVSIDLNTRSDLQATNSGIEGYALTNTRTNAGMAAQLPYYSNSGFTLVDLTKEYNNRDTLSDGDNDWWQATWRYNKVSGADLLSGSILNAYYATGPDFDLVFFLNVPVLSAISIATP